ncbi:cytochrome c oxidase accessory protein CcoG [Teichococcus oryzae]|uniref:Cytochrome c oxidase accessory protein CcoG n=1 Tax=Teichococcus oryzae TaxID=1608942 RepID=A0A5B2THN7_9PROT|nr:cytochrome c oxidase accessory protein CcoG [Pseudoroseomonas oryzae]KAA2213997.1 cytochrome c oxidase accessory protein CcoG [Pseudoroseomonas oryzae]
MGQQQQHHAAEEPPATFYAPRVRVYPQAVKGKVRRLRWGVLWLLLGLYYLAPWLRWDRGPGRPDQAFLADMEHGRLFFLGLEIWPQEVYYVTGLLVLAAIGLFAVTCLAGRLWCGFACPQTVWTDLFMWVERRIEGDRNARMRRDRKPRWSWDDRLRKATKHVAWVLIALATGGAWVMYFTDAPTLLRDLARGEASSTTLFFIGLFTATTYLLAGWAREQVCTYMCPWPRFQAAMLDEQSLVVSYRAWRGEPRGKPRDAAAGDCVDCAACVHVCPTGVDIRDGQQLGCISCGLCIDACDAVMQRLDRPQGLIAFDTLGNLARAEAATAGMPRGAACRGAGLAVRQAPNPFRPRLLLYAAALLVVGGAMLGGLLLREPVALDMLRDRAPLFVRLSHGGIRNAYTLKIRDRRHEAAQLAIAADGLPPGTQLSVSDAETDAAGRPLVATRADDVATLRLLVTAPAPLPAASTPVVIRLLDPRSGAEVARAENVFLGPQP